MPNKCVESKILGNKFGRLTPTHVHEIVNGTLFFYCKCDCGGFKIVKGPNLLNNRNKSCGCISRERAKEMGQAKKGVPSNKAKNLTGSRFGKLLVIESAGFKFIGKYKNRRSYLWLCKCDCGSEVIRSSSTLLGLKELSCGCDTKIKNDKNFTDKYVYRLYEQYKTKSNERKIEFELSESEFCDIVKSKCFYCGNIYTRILNKKLVKLNGVDRVNNNLGYTVQNSVPCCKWCNMAKSDRTIEDFISWIKSAHDNLFK